MHLVPRAEGLVDIRHEGGEVAVRHGHETRPLVGVSTLVAPIPTGRNMTTNTTTTPRAHRSEGRKGRKKTTRGVRYAVCGIRYAGGKTWSGPVAEDLGRQTWMRCSVRTRLRTPLCLVWLAPTRAVPVNNEKSSMLGRHDNASKSIRAYIPTCSSAKSPHTIPLNDKSSTVSKNAVPFCAYSIAFRSLVNSMQRSQPQQQTPFVRLSFTAHRVFEAERELLREGAADTLHQLRGSPGLVALRHNKACTSDHQSQDTSGDK